ncbi:hypothetical protein [Halalkalibacillus halophilus]|uniref:hypothetical protein n=1 Tax=Halalkalibacillus halophilus TaxID=392827 RepID=UPI0003FD018E|nr:hypothetical protein [Halalkalibacillus halophilus]
MSNWMIYLLGIILFIIGAYLLLGRISWFSRSEIYKTIKPKDAETEKTPGDLFDFYTQHSNTAITYEPWNTPEGDAKVSAAFFDTDHADALPVSIFNADAEYYRQKSLRSLTQSLKFLGFTGSMSHSSRLVSIARHVVYNVLKPLMLYLLVIFIILFGFIFIIIDRDIGIFIEFLPFFLLIGIFLYSFHLIKEFIVYIFQNLRSLRLAKAFGLAGDKYKAVSGYLWKSYLLYIIFQVVKIFLIIVCSFLILGMTL